ncbi:MAG: hypothetical protein FJ029_11760, partial [Actinobacteria bacterium]|nr:hypothetical protein [Actinomycetota bacterium]
MQRRTFLQRTVIMAVTGAAAAAGPGFGLAPADETTGTDADELPTLARFQLRGTITAIHANPTSTDLGGHRIVADASVNPDLKIEGTLEVGAIAHVAGYLQRSGDALQLMASRIEVRPAESQRFRLSGVVSELNAEAKFIVIDGQKIMLDASKVPSLTVDPSVKVGVRALAQGLVLEGVKYAILVRAVAAEREGFHVKGVVSELDPEGKFIVIDGQRIVLDASIVPTLRIDPAVKAGGLAEAFGLVLDGFKYAVVVWAGERERFEVEGLVRELD